MDLIRKHTSKDAWLVKMLALAALSGSAFFYLKGVTPADILASVL